MLSTLTRVVCVAGCVAGCVGVLFALYKFIAEPLLRIVEVADRSVVIVEALKCGGKVFLVVLGYKLSNRLIDSRSTVKFEYSDYRLEVTPPDNRGLLGS
jgi:hypothetical protein